jgi:hypothetical protein
LKKKKNVKTRFAVDEEELETMRAKRAVGKENLPEKPDNLADQLNDTQKKFLEVLFSDFGEEPEKETERSVFKRLRGACQRAGLLDGKNRERDFFRVLADPKLNEMVKAIGKGLVGAHIGPLIETQIKLALEGNQTALDRLFELVGLKQSKYDFYLQRVAMNKTDINVGGDLNFEGKTDAELKELVASFRDVSEAEATVS